jgi:hypothetical protein
VKSTVALRFEERSVLYVTLANASCIYWESPEKKTTHGFHCLFLLMVPSPNVDAFITFFRECDEEKKKKKRR